jgi:hypothetical protein
MGDTPFTPVKETENFKVCFWEGVRPNAPGVPVVCDQRIPHSVQVHGEFGAGGSVVIEGSIDGEKWESIDQSPGFPLNFTIEGLEKVGTCPLWIRPRAEGSSVTKINVYLLMRKG